MTNSYPNLNDMTPDLLTIAIEPTTASRLAAHDPSRIEFGKVFADHMLAVEFDRGRVAGSRALCPTARWPLSPANSALHYGQAIFEGMKAYRQAAMARWPCSGPSTTGSASTPRPSAWLCPTIPEDIFLHGLRELLQARRCLGAAGCRARALYIRPFMFATDGFLGVRPSETAITLALLPAR